MKRFALIATLLTMFLFATFSTSNINAHQPPTQCTPIYPRMADTNADCVVNLDDSITLQQMVWLGTPEAGEYHHLDLNQSGGNLDNTDILIMQLYLAGRVINLPVLDGSVDASLVTTKWGDCNANGIVNVNDLAFMANFLAGNIILTPQQRASCDVQWNGIINVGDLSVLANWLAGNIDVLPLIPPQ